MWPFCLQPSRHGSSKNLEKARDQAEAEHICICFAFFLRLPTYTQDRWLLYSEVCAAGLSPRLGINPKSKGEAWYPSQSCSPSASPGEGKEHVVLLLTSYYGCCFHLNYSKWTSVCIRIRNLPVTSHWGSAFVHNVPRKVREKLL